MSANVDKMFSVRQNVWWQGTGEDHGQASIISDHPSWKEARELAGLGWDPEESPLYRRTATDDELQRMFADVIMAADLTDTEKIDRLVKASQATTAQVKGWKHIGRDDDPAATLACTMDTYAMVGNSAFGEIFEAVLEQDNVKFETGGCLDGGRAVWMLSKLDEPITLPGDDTATMPFLALMARHDAMGAVILKPTMVRIVCSNTFQMAEMSGTEGRRVVRSTEGTFKFVHRGNYQARLEDAKRAVNAARKDVKAYVQIATELLGVKVTPAQTERFVTSFIPAPPAGAVTDRVMNNIEEARKAIRGIINGRTVEGTGVKGTAYGLVQAAGEYLDHVRRARSWETKLNRSLITPEPLKATATRLALEVASS